MSPDRAAVSLEKHAEDDFAHGAGLSPAGGAEAPVEGRLAIAVRVPVRIVTLLLILPVRMVWDALTVCGRLLKRVVWVPFARAMSWLWRTVLAPVLFALLVWPWLALWRYLLAPVGRALSAAAKGVGAALVWLGRTLVLAPATWTYSRLLAPLGHGLLAVLRGLGTGLKWLGRYALVVPGRAVRAAILRLVDVLIVLPAAALHRYVLTPLGHGVVACVRGVGVGLAWLWRYLVVVPCGFGYRYVLTPLGHGVVACVRGVGAGLAWLWRYLVVAPCGFVYRWVLTPVGRGIAVVAREIADALGHAWRVAGYISRAVFRFLGAVLRFLFADPAVWVWQHVARPLGRGLRDALWRPAAQAIRSKFTAAPRWVSGSNG
ncbi:hypothetical protein, partial [Streptomyces albidus (ex Kaewkla and Franco 2022)]|uniref:hypothetical protein n=1 Tax=Streptomyces albidus (ex Kaewkla and Franco 2022) TaxID=722709 RepID=UPI0015EF3527